MLSDFTIHILGSIEVPHNSLRSFTHLRVRPQIHCHRHRGLLQILCDLPPPIAIFPRRIRYLHLDGMTAVGQCVQRISGALGDDLAVDLTYTASKGLLPLSCLVTQFFSCTAS